MRAATHYPRITDLSSDCFLMLHFVLNQSKEYSNKLHAYNWHCDWEEAKALATHAVEFTSLLAYEFVSIA